MDLKKLLATVVTAGVIVTGTAGVASAATSPSATSSSATSSSTATPSHAKAHHHLRHRALRAGAKIAASTIGIDVKTLVKEVRSGKSVAAVAQANSVDPQKVIDAMVTAFDQKIDQLVTAGKLSTERAATLKAKLPTVVTRVVNRTRVPR